MLPLCGPVQNTTIFIPYCMSRGGRVGKYFSSFYLLRACTQIKDLTSKHALSVL